MSQDLVRLLHRSDERLGCYDFKQILDVAVGSLHRWIFEVGVPAVVAVSEENRVMLQNISAGFLALSAP
jgi:hypothetical protein